MFTVNRDGFDGRLKLESARRIALEHLLKHNWGRRGNPYSSGMILEQCYNWYNRIVVKHAV